jgi:hypothetical protein
VLSVHPEIARAMMTPEHDVAMRERPRHVMRIRVLLFTR